MVGLLETISKGRLDAPPHRIPVENEGLVPDPLA